jgi:hypothetical protein
MNKITLGFFLAKSKATIKGLLMLFAFLFMNTQVSWGQTAIVPKLYLTSKNVTSGAIGWTMTAVTNNATTDYWKLLSTGNSMTSPSMDFSIYSSINLALSLQSFGAIVSNSDKIKIEFFDGSTWTQVGSLLATTGTRGTQNVSLPYTYSGAQIRITAPNANTTAGARVYSVEITGIVALSGPEINIKGNAVSIVDGATPASTTNDTDFGTVATSTNVIKTYTIENTGSVDLVLTPPYVQKSLATTVFTITQPTLTTIPAGSSTTFSVTFNSAAAGSFDEVIEVLSDDADEGVYDFAIKAIAQTPTPNIVVKGNSAIIAVGDTTPSTADQTDFGNSAINTNVVKTYTIENTGTGDLTVNDILMLNSPTSKYTIGGISLPATIVAGGSTTFTVTFNSAAAGTFADTVIITNDDPTDSSYTFAVTTKTVVLNFGVGDISITALANDSPDGISFVNWLPIPVDAELYFTDNAWDGTALLTNEGSSMLWKNNTGSIIPVGTVIYITTLTASLSTDLGSVTGALDGLSASGENLFVYEGSAASPNFIYGLSNLAWLTTGTVNSNNSYLPTALNVTNGNIVTGDFDNVEYSGALAPKDEKSSFAAYRTLVNNPVNWTKNNTYFALNSADFELAAVWEMAAWTDGLTPSASLKTVIKDTYTTTSNGVFTAKKLTVKVGGSLTINSGTSLTVQNEVINSGNVVVENNANLIQVNNTTNSGNITVNRNSNSLYRLDYTIWSSPVASQNLLAFSPLTSVVVSPPSSRFYNYDTTSNLYSTITDPSAATFASGAGYLIRMPNTAPDYPVASTFSGIFNGVPYNGDVPVTLNYVDALHGYNMVGNPYSSTIDANKFITDNTANIESTLYFWRKKNGSGTAYAAYNPAGGTSTYASTTSETPNGTIQVGQGFFVQAKSAGTVPAFFTNAMRLPSTSTQFFKTKNSIEKNRVWLNLTNTTGVFSQALVAYLTDATQGIDIFDGKYINDSPIALTSNINNEEYIIQGRALPFDPSDVVALNFKTNVAGDYTIAIDHVDGLFASSQEVYLLDNNTGTATDLKAGAYTFTAATGVDNARFSLKYQKTLGTNNAIFNDNSVTVYKNKGTLYVNSGSITINNIKVFDIQGRLIAEQKNLKANTATIKDFKATQQVLIVKITSQDNKVVSKKVVN